MASRISAVTPYTHAHTYSILFFIPQVTKLQELFPSANVTKMVSRTPGIMYLDVDRTLRPKAEWIQEAVGLDPEGLDRLVEEGAVTNTNGQTG